MITQRMLPGLKEEIPIKSKRKHTTNKKTKKSKLKYSIDDIFNDINHRTHVEVEFYSRKYEAAWNILERIDDRQWPIQT